MNYYFPDNSPVTFGPDINSLDCDCGGQHYKQLVETSDITRFQLPNNCPETWGSEMVANGDFASALGGWFQGTGNGAVNEWASVGSKARGVPTSKILNQPLPMDQFEKYKLSIDLTLNSGCTIKLVGYKSYSGEDSDDYDVIYEFTSTGTQLITFIPPVDYIRIGFILEGDCTNSDIDNVSLKKASYSCLEICIKDTEDNLIANVPSGSITHYGDFIYVQVDWAALGVSPGCYKICICNDEALYAENLFTLADNGSFESDSTGITSNGSTPARTTTQAYRGLYSYTMGLTAGSPEKILITTAFTLKRNTTYRLGAWVKIALNLEPPTNRIYWQSPLSTGFTGCTVDDQQDLTDSDTYTSWNEVWIEFTTNNSGNVGHFELMNDGFGGSAYIDNIILYEVDAYTPCSQEVVISDTHTCTFLLEWYNDEPAFGKYYNGDSSIKHSIRVKGKFRNPTYDGEKETFKNTEGRRIIVHAEIEKKEQLILEELPAYVHDAIAAGLNHDHFLIDGVEYVQKEPNYAPNWRKSSSLAPVIIDVVKKTQDLRNSYC